MIALREDKQTLDQNISQLKVTINSLLLISPSDTSRPKKPEEVNGREYFFVPRPVFEADIVAHKFVEHGELQGHYYGTSLDAIRRVVMSGKICILNLHCEVKETSIKTKSLFQAQWYI